jgi:hypothetical protein
MTNVIGKAPEFTTDDSVGAENVNEEVKETETASAVEEKETPSELPTEEKPADDTNPESAPVEDVKQVQGILSEREKLLKEIQELRAERRTLRKAETQEVITEMTDKLDDLDPTDIQNIDRVFKAKGYITKDEFKKTIYEEAKTKSLNEFLEKYPEYKPENDPNDVNWNAFQRELNDLKMPSDPTRIKSVLEKAHKLTTGFTGPVNTNTSRRIAIAQKGGGGSQRSTVGKTLSPAYKRALEDGGWSEADIKELEDK